MGALRVSYFGPSLACIPIHCLLQPPSMTRRLIETQSGTLVSAVLQLLNAVNATQDTSVVARKSFNDRMHS